MLVEVNGENWAYADMLEKLRKGRNTLIALFRYFSLLFHQNSASGSFLKVSSNVESEISSVKLYSYVKIRSPF